MTKAQQIQRVKEIVAVQRAWRALNPNVHHAQFLVSVFEFQTPAARALAIRRAILNAGRNAEVKAKVMLFGNNQQGDERRRSRWMQREARKKAALASRDAGEQLSLGEVALCIEADGLDPAGKEWRALYRPDDKGFYIYQAPSEGTPHSSSLSHG